MYTKYSVIERKRNTYTCFVPISFLLTIYLTNNITYLVYKCDNIMQWHNWHVFHYTCYKHFKVHMYIIIYL